MLSKLWSAPLHFFFNELKKRMSDNLDIHTTEGTDSNDSTDSNDRTDSTDSNDSTDEGTDEVTDDDESDEGTDDDESDEGTDEGTDDDDDERESTETDSDESDPDSYKFKRKVIYRNLHRLRTRFDITYLNNEWKHRKHPGIFAISQNTEATKQQISKYNKLYVITMFHQHCRQTGKISDIPGFKQKYNRCYRGKNKWINKMSDRTWQRWSAEFKPDSAKFKRLKKYVLKTHVKQTKKKYRFYFEPLKNRKGILPILEEYLVEYRKLVASECQWRSIQWFQDEAKRITQNEYLMELLKRLMQRQELKLLKRLKCSYNWLREIMVYFLYTIFVFTTFIFENRNDTV